MAEIEHALDSADKCSKDDIGQDSDADPNACAGNDLLLITASPLSEMVWSQREGLSLQDVASSISEKKASLLWNTESFRIVISSPKCADCGESSNSKNLAGGDFNHLRLKPNCEGKIFDSVLPGSPRNTNSSKEGSLIRIDEHESRNFRDLKTSNKIEVGLDKEISRNNQSAEKEVENNTSSVDTLRTNTHKVDTIQDEDLFSGPDNPAQNAEHLKELGSDIPLASDSNIRHVHSHIKESDQMETCHASSSALQPADQGCLLTKPGNQKVSSGPNTAECRYDLDLNTMVETVEYTNGWKTRHLTRSNPVERKCYNEVQIVGFGVQQPSEAQDESFRAPHKGKSVLMSSVGNLSYSNMGKGKQVIGNSEESSSSSSSSKSSGDSHDSAESCNSKRLVSPGKRARSCDLRMSVVNKKLKKQICEGSSPGSFLRQESSFMNWASTITNGFSRFAGATPLAFVPPPSPNIEGNPNFLSLSHVESKDIGITCRNTGFKSLFQSLYLPSVKANRDMNGYCPADAAAKELQDESEQFGYSSSQIHSNRMEFHLNRILPTGGDSVSKYHSHSEQINASSPSIGGRDELHKEVSMPAERLNKIVHRVKEIPSTNGNVSPGDSSFPENPKCDFGLTGNHSNVGSTSSSHRNNCQAAPFGGKGASAVLAVESSSELVSHNRSALLQNSWITRFSPKVSSNKPNSSLHMQDMNLSTETLDPQFQNNAATSKDQGCSENSCLPPVQSQMSVVDARKLESLKTGNQKRTSSNLNPILPSPKFQKTEPIVSTFARRLDILRNPKLPKVPDNYH